MADTKPAPDDVGSWLQGIGLGRHATAFAAEAIDLRSVRDLDEADMIRLGLPYPDRRHLMAETARLQHASTDRQQSEALAGMTAERRLLTVLSIDIVASTSLAHSLDPEDLRHLLQRFQTAVTAAVIRYDGYVAKFVGDGVIAYFGWPRAHEDEAERAVRAARDIFTAVRALARDENVPLRVRAGIATGEVVVGDIVGEHATDDAAVTGVAPSLADRLQAIAEPFEVVIGATTRDLLRGAFALEDLGAVPLKGFSHPVGVWRVIGESVAETRFDAAMSGIGGTFEGREKAMDRLRACWEDAKQGRGQTVVISGEAGIGKSRLISEFRRTLSDEPRYGVRYQCSTHFQNRDLHPVIDRLRRATGLAESDAPALRLAKLQTHLTTVSPEAETHLPLLADLMGLTADGGVATVAMTPLERRRRTVESLIAQVLFIAEQHPVLLVAEDIHWADPSTLDYLSELSGAITDARVMMLVTHRPNIQPSWPGEARVGALELGRIGPDQSRAIARAAGGDGLSEATLASIVARSDGIPLFIEELTKTAAQNERADTATAVPATLYTALVARIDRMGDARRVAQLGAVLGREFSHATLDAMMPGREDMLRRGLQRLEAERVLTRRGSGPTASYAFRHALIHDAAYATLLRRKHKALHARALELLQAAVAPGEAGRLDLLGHHAAEAEAWEAAFGFYRHAAQQAVDRFALREAAQLFGCALAAAHRLPEDAASMSSTLDVVFALRNVLWATGRFAEILEHMVEAERLAERLSEPVRLGWVSAYRAASHWQLGEPQHALDAATSALEVAKAHSERDLAVAAEFYLGCLHATSGAVDASADCFAAVVARLPGTAATEKCGLPFAPAIIARSWLIWAHAERGDFAAADHNAAEAMALAEASGLPFNIAHVCYDIGYCEIQRGDPAAAIAVLDRGLKLIDRWEMTYLRPFTLGFLGYAHLRDGAAETGLAHLVEAVGDYDRINLGLFRALVEAQHAEALLRTGRRGEALDALYLAERRARSRGELGHEGFCHIVRGDAFAGRDREQAAASFARALEVATTLRNAPMTARCQQALAANAPPLDG